jgi:hypothetical protein
MEMVMTSKTNDTSNIATLEDQGTLADSELDAVTGGKAMPKLLETAVKGHVFKQVEIHGT